MTSSSSSFWPARGAWNQKSVTPGPDLSRRIDDSMISNASAATSVQSKLRRPRTVSGKLRFADQLELQAPSQEVIEEV